MIIMLQDFTADILTPKERRRIEIIQKWTFLDSLQWYFIKFKKRFLHYKAGTQKYIMYGDLRKNVCDYLRIEGFKVKQYVKTNGSKYHYIYFK